VLLDRVGVAVPSAWPQILNRSGQPLFCSGSESETPVYDDLLATSATREQLITQGASGGDAALDCPPSLSTTAVLEPDLERAVWPTVDVSFHAYAAGRV